jgi:hypothetical protein
MWHLPPANLLCCIKQRSIALYTSIEQGGPLSISLDSLTRDPICLFIFKENKLACRGFDQEILAPGFDQESENNKQNETAYQGFQ